jgi:hypothetical protein
MVKTTTKFVNGTTTPFALKEGNAGVYTHVCNLGVKAPNNQHSIEIDHNATYREYVVATGIQGQRVLVTSDDCAEYSTIKIVKCDDHNTYKFEGVNRADAKGKSEGSGLFGWLKFWNRKAESV